MRIFEAPNMNGFCCPICNTNKEGKVILVIKDGTEKDRTAEGIQVHLDCLELRIITYKEMTLIYQRID